MTQQEPPRGMTREELPLLAQAALAAVDGADYLDRMAGASEGGDRRAASGKVPGQLGEWETALHDGLADRTIRLCPHIMPRTPVAMFWFAWKPDQLACPRCAEVNAKSVNGTDEDNLCDVCREPDDVMELIGVQLPAAVLRDGTALGPLMIQGGLCRKCWKAESEVREALGLPPT